MATRRATAWSVWHYGKATVPFVISFGLTTWLIWHIGPDKLLEAFSTSDWPWLVLATVVQFVLLFLWDTINLWWLFSQPHPDQRPPFRMFLRARTDSVLWSALNLEIGQGVFAYKLARALNESIPEALGRFLVLALFDFGTLQALGLVGSFLITNALIDALRWVCVVSTVGLLVLALVLAFLPRRWRQWLENQAWASWLRWWGWRQSLLLGAQRLILFLLVILYAWIGLTICGIYPGPQEVFGAIPWVIIAESLPGTGGLGERETALMYLLDPGDKAAVLLSFGLIWSTVVIFGRLLVGCVSWWLPHPEEQRSEVRGQKSEADASAAPYDTYGGRRLTTDL